MKKFLVRLCLLLLTAVALYLGACIGLRWLLVEVVNDKADRLRCQLYFNKLWIRPDLAVELREVAFVTSTGPEMWTAERAELRFSLPKLLVREADFSLMRFYNVRLSFFVSQLVPPKPAGPDVFPRIVHKWVLKEFDTRWTVRIENLDLFDARVAVYDDRVTPMAAPLIFDPVRLAATRFCYPLRTLALGYNLKGTLLQPGGRNGRVSFLGMTYPVSLDTDTQVHLEGIDLNHVRTLLGQQLSKSIRSGVANLDARAKIHERALQFPCTVELSDFAIEPETSLLNIPYKVLSSVLVKSGSHMNLVVDVGGELGQPEFKVRDEFSHSLEYGVGNTVTRSAKTVFGLGTGIVSVGGDLLRAVFGGGRDKADTADSSAEADEPQTSQVKEPKSVPPIKLNPVQAVGQGIEDVLGWGVGTVGGVAQDVFSIFGGEKNSPERHDSRPSVTR